MSKYVRTKDDKIFEVIDFCDWAFLDGTVEKVYEIAQAPRFLKESETINEADTIEDLCDEIVVILPNEKPYPQFYRIMDNFDNIKGHYLKALSVEPKTECYGAIWTDKGLIYIAKMNNKGELELL